MGESAQLLDSQFAAYVVKGVVIRPIRVRAAIVPSIDQLGPGLVRANSNVHRVGFEKSDVDFHIQSVARPCIRPQLLYQPISHLGSPRNSARTSIQSLPSMFCPSRFGPQPQ
jgi:hypothetical protein